MPTKTVTASDVRDDAELSRLCGAANVAALGVDYGIIRLERWRAEWLQRREPARNSYGQVIPDEVARHAMQSVSNGLSHDETRRCVALLAREVAKVLAAEAGL